ncbi:LysR family transcriptional regulator [Kitasatospora aburaviensis]
MTRPELPFLQLHAFVVLAEELHFGHAAERLGIAQPPLSQQIRRLEEKVGHPLFHREPGRVTLTPAGRELLPAAQRALADVADGLAAARTVGSGRAGRLRIGFAASLALTVLPGLLRTFRQRFPDVQLDVREMTTAPSSPPCRTGVSTSGCCANPRRRPGARLPDDPPRAVRGRAPGRPPAGPRRTVRLADLAESPFVLLPREVGPRLHDRIIALCATAGFTPHVAQRAVEWQTLCALVQAGLGVTLAPASIRRIRLDGVVFRRTAPGDARTRVAVAWRRHEQNPLIANLLAAVDQDPPEPGSGADG